MTPISRGALVVVAVLGACGDADTHPDAPRPPIDAAIDAPPIDAAPRLCTADAQCPGGVCHENTGECYPDAQVLFVAMGGAISGECTRAAPCATVARAASLLSSTRNIIAIAGGSYAGRFTVSKPVLISGPTTDPTAVFLSSPAHDQIIALLDGDTAMVIEGVSIGGNTAGSTPQAVSIGGDAFVMLDRVIVRDNGGVGVAVVGGTLLAQRFEAFGNATAISAGITSPIEVDRAYIHDNTSSGIAAGAGYLVTNTILANNAIGFVPFNDNTGTLDFVTFVASGATATEISSVHEIKCTNSIFARDAPQISEPVVVTYSLFRGPARAGIGNATGDPMFVNAAAGNYHIGPASAAIDRADPASTVPFDFDGDPRPAGSRRDVGADER